MARCHGVTSLLWDHGKLTFIQDSFGFIDRIPGFLRISSHYKCRGVTSLLWDHDKLTFIQDSFGFIAITIHVGVMVLYPCYGFMTKCYGVTSLLWDHDK